LKVEVRCPECGRFLGEVEGYARVVCPNDGWSVTVESKDQRLGRLPTRASHPDTIIRG